jgi:hypothetical protein
MPNFDRLFEQYDELRGKSDVETRDFRDWTLILGLAVSAIGTMVTFNTSTTASLYGETKRDFLTVAKAPTSYAHPHKVLASEGPLHWPVAIDWFDFRRHM